VNVPVRVEKDGDEPVVTTVPVKVQRDTDGDGTPDKTDTDDDNDGIPDDQDTNPKATDKLTVTPSPESKATQANPYQPVVNYAPVDTLSIKQKAKETATLPSTGETNSSLLAAYGALGLMAGLGLVARKKRRDDEA
ncbi:LPXTG cell wall anchor domain-containing protein, partial [Streptococcus pluranimalium]|uniref:LPXTG cell wall anchor domain-containing protein n=1 Tax=Streptococcus pluranimalium TaxID=82348 RepID=UPI0039FCEF10